MKINDMILNEISDELNISKTMNDNAIASYEAVGNFVSNRLKGDGILVEIYPQGSFNLGTVIKPLSDEDSGYDIDLVVEIVNTTLGASETKLIVGKCLRDNRLYSKNIREGKRCWTIDYKYFHMDILPCLSDNSTTTDTVSITHRNTMNYYEFKESNPKGYKDWFDYRNCESLKEVKTRYAQKHKIQIEEVPNYSVRTNLQKSIQILKRHRDIMFNGSDDAPISIIITTLAAQAFIDSLSLEDTLIHLIKNMTKFIEVNNGITIISNPVNKNENFADKWNENNNKKDNFGKWIKKLENDFINVPRTNPGLDNLISHYKSLLGETVVSKSALNFGEKIRGERSKGNLFMDTSNTNLSKEDKNSIEIKEHTFYGNLI